MTRDERRSARLLFAEELAFGVVDDSALATPEVLAVVRARPIPSPFSRRLQRRELEAGSLTHISGSVEPMLAARASVLGELAAGPPRVLVRVDGFPDPETDTDPATRGTAAFREVHELLREQDVPYLLAFTPRVAERHADRDVNAWRPLDDAEQELLARLRADGVAFGLRGLDHRQSRSKRVRSELVGRKRADLVSRLDAGAAELRRHHIDTDVFVAPFDTFSGSQYGPLAERHAILCGGPASVGQLGFFPSPLYRQRAVYMPSYPPFHGDAQASIRAIEELATRGAALWIPIVLRWADEDRSTIRAFASAVHGLARSWDEFEAAVRATSDDP